MLVKSLGLAILLMEDGLLNDQPIWILNWKFLYLLDWVLLLFFVKIRGQFEKNKFSKKNFQKNPENYFEHSEHRNFPEINEISRNTDQ